MPNKMGSAPNGSHLRWEPWKELDKLAWSITAPIKRSSCSMRRASLTDARKREDRCTPFAFLVEYLRTHVDINFFRWRSCRSSYTVKAEEPPFCPLKLYVYIWTTIFSVVVVASFLFSVFFFLVFYLFIFCCCCFVFGGFTKKNWRKERKEETKR